MENNSFYFENCLMNLHLSHYKDIPPPLQKQYKGFDSLTGTLKILVSKTLMIMIILLTCKLFFDNSKFG